MGRIVKLSSALVAGVCAFVVGTSTAEAQLDKTQFKCQTAIAKEGLKFVQGQLKVRDKCIRANLKAGGNAVCPTPDAAALQKLRDKLDKGLAKKCGAFLNVPGNLAVMGFPGACSDPDTLDGFTLTDLQNCIADTHEALVTGICVGGNNAGETCADLSECPDQGAGTSCRGLLTAQYDPAVTAAVHDANSTCQKTIAKSGTKFVLTVMKNVQKCRNGLLNCKVSFEGEVTCKLTGFLAVNCATADPKTAASIQKAKDKAESAITSKCTDANVVALKACDPDQVTATATALCETEIHQDYADNPVNSEPYDFLDFEYATRGFCGDGRKNQPSEECDGTDDDACPGQCGDEAGLFACLCQDIPRTRVVEHANSDLDNGWSGQSHDSGIVEGGGYVTDLWDCDGPGGSDPICAVGPTCSLAPNSPCNPAPNSFVTGNSICSGLGQGVCRKTAGGSTGPRCEIEFQKRCDSNAQCTMLGDRCIKTPHGAPLPLSSGGVSVCVLNIFSEDVVGTTNLDTGAGSIRLRQRSITHLGPVPDHPCPVCGGFCSGAVGDAGATPGVRNRCASDADCSGGATCVLDNVCSYGPNFDQPCRPSTPYGGTTEFFGNPSVDCPPASGTNISGDGLDILFNPASTTSVSLTSTVDCGTAGYTNRICTAGANQYAPCTVNSECPGGTCNEQCFCNSAPADGQRPNACANACWGGANDAEPCGDDSECPGGFCRVADCRLNPGDTDSAQEGECTTGPSDQVCSYSTFKPCIGQGDPGCSNEPVCLAGANADTPCTTNSECPGSTCGTLCPFCQDGETCVSVPRQCFVNPTITRTGSPGVPDRVSAAIFCIAKTSAPSVNNVAGLPGPGAITQPATTYEVGF